MVAMDPDNMDSVVRDIFSVYAEYAGRLHFIDSKLGSFSCFFISEEGQKLLHNQITSYMDGIRWIYDLVDMFCDAFVHYTDSGISGNPADISGIIGWQSRFCVYGLEIAEYCRKMVDCLIKLKFDLKHKEELIIMSCVYASPELMGNNVLPSIGLDMYPLIHAKASVDGGNTECVRKLINDAEREKVCKNCGTPIMEGTIFCMSCGIKID